MYVLASLVAVLVGQSLQLPSVEVKDEAGRAMRLDALAGTPVVLTMGYTACKTRCPMTIEAMKRVEAAFENAQLEVALVVVTLDPQADTVKKLTSVKQARGLSARWHPLAPAGRQLGRHGGARACAWGEGRPRRRAH